MFLFLQFVTKISDAHFSRKYLWTQNVECKIPHKDSFLIYKYFLLNHEQFIRDQWSLDRAERERICCVSDRLR